MPARPRKPPTFSRSANSIRCSIEILGEEGVARSRKAIAPVIRETGAPSGEKMQKKKKDDTTRGRGAESSTRSRPRYSAKKVAAGQWWCQSGAAVALTWFSPASVIVSEIRRGKWRGAFTVCCSVSRSLLHVRQPQTAIYAEKLSGQRKRESVHQSRRAWSSSFPLAESLTEF